jgi:hypothetical protein
MGGEMEPIVLEISAQDQNRLCDRDTRAFFAASRFYNPAISLWFTQANTVLRKNQYIAFHQNYFFGLSRFAKGVKTESPKEAIKGLELLFNAIGPVRFKEFILFEGIFRDTAFLVNQESPIQIAVRNSHLPQNLILKFPDEKPFNIDAVKKLPLIDDGSIEIQIDSIQGNGMVGALILPKDCLSQIIAPSIEIFFESGNSKRPKEALMKLFNGMENIETPSIRSLDCANPFSQLITGVFEPGFNAFFQSIECLLNGEFVSVYHKKIARPNKAIQSIFRYQN